jgi:16S rRNA (guanine966-N2)-methyltransferase
LIRLGRGKWNGHLLRPFLMSCRPTSGLVRGAVFNIAGDLTATCSMAWDLCSGSGAVGLEALSIGASTVAFVDKDRASARLIAEFLRERDALGAALLLTGDVRRLVPLKTGDRPGLVFIDPPYGELYLYEWIWSLDWDSLLAPAGMVFVESGHHPALEKWSTRRYGDSFLSWMRKGPD